MVRGLLTFAAIWCSLVQALALDDMDRWLEARNSPEVMNWVRLQNRRSLSYLKAEGDYQGIFLNTLRSLQRRQPKNIGKPYGRHQYYFKQNGMYGYWRKAPMASPNEKPRWVTIARFDLKGQSGLWSFKGSDCLAPDFERCLLYFSDKEESHLRLIEFDTAETIKVKNGFNLTWQKPKVSWFGKNGLLVGLAEGKVPGASSFGKKGVYYWRRGQAFKHAKRIFNAFEKDIMLIPRYFPASAPNIAFIEQYHGFFEKSLWTVAEDLSVKKILGSLSYELYGASHDALIIQTLEDTKINGKKLEAGTLFAMHLKNLQAPPQILLHRKSKTSIQDVSVEQDTILVHYLDQIKSQILLISNKKGTWISTLIDQLEVGESVQNFTLQSGKKDFYASISSFLRPNRLVGFKNTGRGYVKLESNNYSTGYDKEFKVQQFFASSADGTKVPYSMVSKKGMPITKDTPVIQYGYGGFSEAQLPFFLGPYLDFLNKHDGVFVVANVRGGNEYGPGWHTQAVGKHRSLSIQDFVGVSHDLMSRHGVSSQKLAIIGASHGGYLVASAMLEQPELYRAVVCKVPVTDLAALTRIDRGSHWTQEYGVSHEGSPPAQSSIDQSPYRQVSRSPKLPRILIITATYDEAVHPGHGRKLASKLSRAGANPLLFEHRQGGHSGPTGSRERAESLSLEISYLTARLNLAILSQISE